MRRPTRGGVEIVKMLRQLVEVDDVTSRGCQGLPRNLRSPYQDHTRGRDEDPTAADDQVT